MAATAAARGGKQSGKSTVFIKTEKQSNDYGQTTTVEDARTKPAVLRTENKQSDKDPKGYVPLRTTIHKNLLCLAAGRMYFHFSPKGR